jgi:hypothetical protein
LKCSVHVRGLSFRAEGGIPTQLEMQTK